MSNNGEFYSQIQGTENEHYFMKSIVINFCKRKGIEMLYYRTLKNGHVPTFREFKVKGDIKIARQLWNLVFENNQKGISSFMTQQKIIDFMEKE